MDLSSLLRRFLVAKTAAGLSPRSIAWYEEQIGVYLRWAARAGIRAERALAPVSLETYLAEQRKAGYKPATMAARYRALSVWCNWLASRKLLAANPMSEIEPPRVPKEAVEYVRPEEFAALYRSISGNDWTALRDRCILLILFWSGLRISELVSLSVPDVDTRNRLITVRSGKGGKGRIVPCPPELNGLLVGYLYARPPYDGDGLFVGNDGQDGVRGPLTDAGVRQMLRRRCQAAGVRRLTPHAFRHGFAMALLNHGMDISALSAAMGHHSVKVTEGIYARWLAEGLTREYDEARARINAKTRSR